jgi:hypothetical protein
MTFGWPMPSSACPAHGQCVVTTWCASSAQHGAALTGVPVAYWQRDVDLHVLQLAGYKPLHQDLGEGGRRGGLTDEAVALIVADGVEG